MPRRSEYVSAVEAAALTGLSERTIRRKIDAGALKATKQGTSYQIRTRDLDRLMTGHHSPTPDMLLQRITELEEILADQAQEISSQAEQISRLEHRMQELEERPTTPAPARTRPLTGQIPPRPVHLAAIRSQAPNDQAEQQPEEEDEGRTPTAPLAAPANMPPGSVLMARFAEQYNIAARTLNDHARKGLISVTVIDRGGRPQYWLTPEQQQAILDQRGL